jgi:hypothetical protein
LILRGLRNEGTKIFCHRDTEGTEKEIFDRERRERRELTRIPIVGFTGWNEAQQNGDRRDACPTGLGFIFNWD